MTQKQMAFAQPSRAKRQEGQPAGRRVTCFRSPSRDCRDAKIFSARCRCGLIDQLTANSAKRGVKTVRFITMRTNRFEPHPAAVAKDRIGQILALTLRANHNGNLSQLSCIVPQFRRAEPKCAHEGSKPCIVPGYAKSNLFYNIDVCCESCRACVTRTQTSFYKTKPRRSEPPGVSAGPAYRTCEYRL
jgi:hypothetical protein